MSRPTYRKCQLCGITSVSVGFSSRGRGHFILCEECGKKMYIRKAAEQELHIREVIAAMSRDMPVM